MAASHRRRAVAFAVGLLVGMCVLLLAGCELLPASLTPAPAPEPGTVPLHVARAGGSVIALVDVTVHGQGPYDFVVDTGASRSVVDQQLAQQLGLPQVAAAPQVTGVSGPAAATVVRISDWSAGDVSLPNGVVAAIDLQLSDSAAAQQLIGRRLYGLIGSDVLSSFGVVTIDYNQQTLALGAQ
ncbi:MAG TPA: retropepsin-like aspartic protease [Chloroflexota bacterium]|nr:retropepsin-like aspartic protease [Chloroflexota bacterium]